MPSAEGARAAATPGSFVPSQAPPDVRPSCGAGGAAAGSACPVNPTNNMPPGSQERAPGQEVALSTTRVRSTIPMSEEAARAGGVPAHQPGATAAAAASTWVYPSEQQFFNAMRRKGWQPDERDMGTVVAIHNAVNERAWREVMQWEALHAGSCPEPKLARFEGKPRDFSPKARMLNFIGYRLPFDRHDWYVDRCGREVRYVIDFYNAAPTPTHPVAMHLDVRPALDSPSALLDRVYMQCRWVWSGRWLGEQPPDGRPAQAAAGPAGGR